MNDLYLKISDPAARPDPYPLYRELRRTPVSWQQTPDGTGTWMVSTYREVVAATQDPRLSSDVRKDPDLAATNSFARSGRTPMFQQLDPPEHDVMREKTMRHFGPPHRPDYIESLRHSIDAKADQLVDEMRGQHEVDIVSALAYRLPVGVICDVLGVPAEDEPQFSIWVHASMSGDEAAANKANGELMRYMGELIERRRKDPRDDMLSKLAAEDWDPDTLSMTAVALLVAGHETTVNLIANGVLTVLRRPEIIPALSAQPELAIPLVEEVLRYEPPAQLVPNRLALTDMTIAGVTIPEGSSVTLALAAANRDPDRFPDPEAFIPDRTDNTHLGFGNGVHYCFGAPLARLETQSALRAFLVRAQQPRLITDPPPYRPSPTLRGPAELRVALAGVS